MIYLDANVVIRLIEGDDLTRAPIEARLLPLRGTGCFIITSHLTRLECRVQPLRRADAKLLAIYDAFFNGLEVQMAELTPAVLDKATQLRASLNFKTPDAIHLASAIVMKASSFVSGDKTFRRCSEIPVEVI